MRRVVKIKKGSTLGKGNDSIADQVARTEQQRDRETANTIKGWIAELEERKRSLRISAARLIRSFESA